MKDVMLRTFIQAGCASPSEVDYCDLSKFPSCCKHVDVFCLFEALELVRVLRTALQSHRSEQLCFSHGESWK